MLAIIFDHTEICFTGDNIVPYRMYVPDVLMAECSCLILSSRVPWRFPRLGSMEPTDRCQICC